VTLGEVLDRAVARLHAAGIESPRREARLLLEHATGIAATALVAFPERPIEPSAEAAVAAAVARRMAHEPLSRILGRREFWSLDFRVTPDTLDPRPDSETLIEAALDRIPDRDAPLELLDLGTGTGCLLLALLSELPNAWGVGIDRSAAALRVAAGNAATLSPRLFPSSLRRRGSTWDDRNEQPGQNTSGPTWIPACAGMTRKRAGMTEEAAMGTARACFVCGDWAESVRGGFDVIVSNPPYIASATIATLAPEVRLHDPITALDGGADGFSAYRRLAPEIARLLLPGGIAVLELGRGQADKVATLLAAAGLAVVEIRADLAGIPRAIVARRADPVK
jgi:release factor glutamine methyltransferase